mgnify:CR=1 FL=1
MAKSGLGAPDLAAASPTPATSPHGLADSQPPSLPCMPVLRLGHPQGMLTLRLAAPVHLHAPKESLSRCHHWLAVWSFAKGGKGLGQPLPRANLPPPSPARASHRRHPCRPPRHQLSWHPIVASRHGLPRRHPCGTPAVDAPACRQLQPDLVRRRRIHLREGWIRLRRH